MILLFGVLGCVDQGFSEVRLDAIAVVLGDFDNVGEPLAALNVAVQEYNGLIVQATYEPDDERTQWDTSGPTVEGLFTETNEKGQLQASAFNAIFLNSGTRGLGAFRYNNQLEPDDSLLVDTEAMDNACTFANGGGTLVVSDWAYDLLEYCWPDALEMAGDDPVADAAQLGVAGDVLAEVKDEKLVESLGATLNIAYDYTAWSVIESVPSTTEVLLSGSIDYQPDPNELPETLDGVPLMVRFLPGRGQVIYTTFHWSAQTSQVAQTLLLDAVEGLSEGAGSESEAVEDDPEAGGA